MAEYIINTDSIPDEWCPDKDKVVTFFGDPVQMLTRCEHCKCRNIWLSFRTFGEDLFWCEYFKRLVRLSDFCSYARRREE